MSKYTLNDYNLNVGYAGRFVKTLPTTGIENEVVITKQGFVYQRRENEWVRVDTTLNFLFLDINKGELVKVHLCSKCPFTPEKSIEFLLDIITNKIYQRRKKEWIVIDELTPLPNPAPNPTHVIHFSSGIVFHSIGFGFELNILPVNSSIVDSGQIGIIGIVGSVDDYPAPAVVPFSVSDSKGDIFALHIHKNGSLRDLHATIHGITITGPPNTMVPLSLAIFISRDPTAPVLDFEQTPLQVTFNLLTNVTNPSMTLSNTTNKIPVSLHDQIFLVAYIPPGVSESVDVKLKVSASVTQLE